MKGKILAVCRSKKKGTVKEEIPVGEFVVGYGLKGDAHGGDWHRQVSLLAKESIDKFKAEIAENKGHELNYGDFAENITTEGIILYELPIGSKMKLGNDVILEVTQIGKKCHHDCLIYEKLGKCIMPKEGIFTRVLNGGKVKAGDNIFLLED